MSKTFETGHAKNVANFEVLITHVQGYGAVYNPSRTTLSLADLQTQLSGAKEAINNLNNLLPNNSNAIALREAGFVPLKKLSTRLINALKATDASAQVKDNAITLHRKLYGKRASAKLNESEKQELLVTGKEVNQISASQLSYDSLVDNFDKLIKLLASIPQYAPNETELQVTSLQQLHAELQAKNARVISQSVPLSNARIQRNKLLYQEETGLVDTALSIKSYVKSIFGATSPQYKQISGLAFKKEKR